MYKILVYGMSTNYGGIERIIMNYVETLPKDKFQFDFFTSFKTPLAYESIIRSRGGKIYYIPSREKNWIKYKSAISKFFRENAQKYDCIWINRIDLVNIDYLKLAKKYHIPRRILHSHSTSIMDKGIKGLIKKCLHTKHRNEATKIATDYWACSQEAARWFYPKNEINKVQIIKNAINISSFSLDIEKRKKIRDKFKLNGKFVIGNIGTLAYPKNQLFVLDIFKKFSVKIPESVLLLVGEGPDKAKIIKHAHELNLEEKVILVGRQLDTQAWYSAFDLFLFPSFFEGVSLSLLEAQANGLPILASDKVNPVEIKINPNIKFLSLSLSAETWTNQLFKKSFWKVRISEKDIINNFNKSGYNLKLATIDLENRFLNK